MTLCAVHHIVSPILNSKLCFDFSDWCKDLELVKPWGGELAKDQNEHFYGNQLS